MKTEGAQTRRALVPPLKVIPKKISVEKGAISEKANSRH